VIRLPVVCIGVPVWRLVRAGDPAARKAQSQPRLTGLLGTADPGVALTAAVALALRMRAAAPEAILSPLMAARDHAVELRETMVDLPWSRSLLGFASLALQRIGLG
jgi:hypothetical protein